MKEVWKEIEGYEKAIKETFERMRKIILESEGDE